MTKKKHPAVKIIETLREEYKDQSLAYFITSKLETPFVTLVRTEAVKAAEREFYQGYKRIGEIGGSLPKKDAKQVTEALNQMESSLIEAQELAVEEMFNVLVGWYLKHHLGIQA